MATTEGNTRPSAAQAATVRSKTTTQARLCSYCQRPIAKTITVGRRPYCGKLCVAMGMIVEVYDEDGIDPNFGSMDGLLDSVFCKGPRGYPVKVRYSDADKFEGTSYARPGWHEVIVVIDDDGTPDWIPEDDLVDKTLLSGDSPREKEASLKPSAQTATTSAVVLSMPQIPQYPAMAREVFALTDVELSTLFDTYRTDGIDPDGCSALHRQTIARLTERHMIDYGEVVKLWRVTELGECIVRTTTLLCDSSSPYRSFGGSKTAKVLAFPSPTVESRAR